jgi:RNA polymerase primary sigma factor
MNSKLTAIDEATVASRDTDVFDLYLAGLREMPRPLDREGEVRAAAEIEDAERACFDILLEHGLAMPELVRWADAFEAGELGVLELTVLGAYEGPEGQRRLHTRLARVRTAELRCESLRHATRGSPSERRRQREAAWRQRAEAARALTLHRERLQESIARATKLLSCFVERPTTEAARERRQRLAIEELGRQRATLEHAARELATEHRRLDAARNRLAEVNLRLVVMLAKSYRRSGVPFPDLVQEGNLGLMRAIDKFDHRVGTRFSTYAAWWVRQAVAREATRQRETVRMPFGLVDKRRRASRAARTLAQHLGREADIDEVAEELGMTEAQARRALESVPRSIPIHGAVSEEGDRAWDEVLANEELPTADEDAVARERREAARVVLEQLTPREQHILRRRFGLDGDGEEVTLREVGLELGLSRERIRQLESMALDKLRAALSEHA